MKILFYYILYYYLIEKLIKKIIITLILFNLNQLIMIIKKPQTFIFAKNNETHYYSLKLENDGLVIPYVYIS